MTGNGEVTDADLLALPNAHLHLHFTGGMRHTTLLELAHRSGILLPERLADLEPDSWQLLGWPRFQRLYDVARGGVRTPGGFHRPVREVGRTRGGARYRSPRPAMRFGARTPPPRPRCSAPRRRRPRQPLASGFG